MKKLITTAVALATLAGTVSASDSMKGWGIESSLHYVGNKPVDFKDTITGDIESPFGTLQTEMKNNGSLKQDNGFAGFVTGTYTDEINEKWLWSARGGVGIDNYESYQLRTGVRALRDVGDNEAFWFGTFAEIGHGGQREVAGSVSTETPFSSSSQSGSVKMDIDESYKLGVEVGVTKFNFLGVDGLTASIGIEVSREKTNTTTLYGPRSTDPLMAAFQEMSESGFSHDYYQTNTGVTASIGWVF